MADITSTLRHSATSNEFVSLELSNAVGEFTVTYGGEEVHSDQKQQGFLKIGRWPTEEKIMPCSIDGGVADFGIASTADLRELARALTLVADRYDAIQASIRGAGAPVERVRRRA